MKYGPNSPRIPDTSERQPGPHFHHSPTLWEYEGLSGTTAVNRQQARQFRAADRALKRNRSWDRHAEKKARGLRKIQQFHRRGNIIILPLNQDEQSAELTALQNEFNENNGVLATDSYMLLNQLTNGEADRALEIWQLMIYNEIDMDGVDNHPDYPNED